MVSKICGSLTRQITSTSSIQAAPQWVVTKGRPSAKREAAPSSVKHEAVMPSAKREAVMPSAKYEAVMPSAKREAVMRARSTRPS